MNRFKKYVKNFNLNNKKIKYKYYHSLRVKKISLYLAKKLELNERDRYIASFIGLYHDIGRFTQATEYNTYKDYKSIDHGTLGYNLLKKDKFLDNFTKEEKNIILTAVKNHNKYSIEKGLNKKEILHSKIIRDADKIDILKMISKEKILDYNKVGFNVVPSIKKDFFKHKIIANEQIVTAADEIIRDLAFIYDINFKESIIYIKNKKYINKIQSKIKNKEYFKEYFDEIFKYMEGMINDVRKKI